MLQHRGQDAAGIMTHDREHLYLRKGSGLVRDVFHADEHMATLRGNMGIGHVRYPTAGCTTQAEAQPLYTNTPFGVALVHNGNLTNTDELKQSLFQEDRRHINTDSDSEVLLNVFAHELMMAGAPHMTPADIFGAVSRVHRRSRPAPMPACLHDRRLRDWLGFRDPFGIRPVIYGRSARMVPEVTIT